jgi:nitrate/TMAO reductase-like tetraheme cytochrome c subunit
MNPEKERPVLHVLGSSWVSMLGVALVTTAGCSWLFVLPVHIRGHVDNPYIGLLVFFAIPVIFFAGLALIPIGIALGKKRVASELSTVLDRKALARRFAIFLAVTTFVNVVIGSQVTYRAVEHMESVQFCGQTCHVMQPEFTAHMLPNHQKVACVDCHVVPGAAGFIQSKMAGTRQLFEVVFNTYPRPIHSAIESNRLAPSADTCEQCHARTKDNGTLLRVIPAYKDDEANTVSYTVLNMMVGGGTEGGIHGAHMGPGVHIRYAAADAKRDVIPWVEYKNSQSGVTRTYLAASSPEAAKPAAPNGLPQFEMQCADCHNRAAHSFELPGRGLDRSFAEAKLPASLPYLKKTGLALLNAPYPSQQAAAGKISQGLASFYRANYPGIAANRRGEILAAAKVISQLYSQNVFPDLKVGWGTYPNNLGHTDAPGCFRCHDDSHATAGKKTITNDCGACHDAVAVDEASPAVLTTLGIPQSKPNP